MILQFHVWSEGFRTNGESSQATYHGCFRAETFREACDQAAAKYDWAEFYDSENLRFWGCRLFDNEHDARRSFG